MTRQHWLILGALGLVVLCVYCAGGAFLLQMLSAPPITPDLAALQTTPGAATIAPPTALAASTPTSEPTARATATWVIAPPPAQTGATSIGTRAPLAPNTTPGATATRRATIVPVGPIMTAWSKAQNVTAYRIEFDWTIKGNLSDVPPGWNTAQGIPLFSIAGAVNGKDSQIALKGILAMLFTGDPTKSIEFLTLSDKTYLRGPAPMMGAPDDKWYVSTGQGKFSTNINEGTMPELPGDATIDWSGFKKSATETLDGKRCDVYRGDKNATTKLFQSVDTGTTNKQSLDTIDNAETKFWICDDGYMHQWTMNIEGRAKDKPTEKVSFQIRLHIWDFNANIKLTPPANPAPLQMPAFDFSFATPTKTK
jgi:hypothetical protein